MIIIPDEMTVDVVAMVDYLKLHQVDWVDCLTPGQLKMMTELVSSETHPQLPVRHVMSSGEALSISVAKLFLTRFPGTSLSNVLSTTETAADICCLKYVTLQLIESLEHDSQLVHVPILDEGQHVVWGNAIGVSVEESGRLLIKGWNIEPAGYLTGEHKDSFINRTILNELQRESVVVDKDCMGCFLTGDRIAWREVSGRVFGCVEGRVDDVVKVRGFRVDLAGVEACLNSCKSVRDAVAICHQDTLYALVVLAGAFDEELVLISNFLKEHLPPSSVPSLVEVKDIEYTKTGKKDRKNMVKYLPSISDQVDLKGVDLWSEEGIMLAMQQQLGVPMKRTDNFFDKGGNSFKVTLFCCTCF
jgi:acyl-coenzyme A synthetase/AMP-(fatty) acid ligase